MKLCGHCPVCGESELVTQDLSTPDGLVAYVWCDNKFCARQNAVNEILSDPETEHIVTLTDDGWSMKHPLRERLDDELLDCLVARKIRQAFELGGPVPEPGTYRVVPSTNDREPWEWEKYGVDVKAP